MYLFTQYSAPVGTLTLCCRRDKLVGLWIEGQKYFGSHSGEMVPGDGVPVLTRTRDWLDRYFAGERPDPGELPLAPEGSPFRQTVWALLLEIPYGQVITYGELARKTAERLGRASMSGQAAWAITPSLSLSHATGWWGRTEPSPAMRADWTGSSGCCAMRAPDCSR